MQRQIWKDARKAFTGLILLTWMFSVLLAICKECPPWSQDWKISGASKGCCASEYDSTIAELAMDHEKEQNLLSQEQSSLEAIVAGGILIPPCPYHPEHLDEI
jgi:hypothetical protein